MSESKIYAELVGNKVVNVILWDGVTEFNPELKLIEVTDGVVGVGCIYEKGKFIDPTYTEDITPIA
jgi:hypothetical protein